jgi:hypothetical protein
MAYFCEQQIDILQIIRIEQLVKKLKNLTEEAIKEGEA